jgi:hypothetical protein
MARTIKNKNCDFCGKKCKVEDMIPHGDKLLCDQGCVELYISSYETEEEKKK